MKILKSKKLIHVYKNKRAHEPWIAHLNPCQEKRMFTTKYIFHSPTLKPILGITQIKTKTYQVTKFNQNYTYMHNSMSELLSNPRPGMCMMSNIYLHNVMCIITFFRKKMFYLLSLYRSQGCVKGQNICMYGVICFINLIMQHDYFQK